MSSPDTPGDPPDDAPPRGRGPRYDEVRAAQLRAVGTAFLRLRPWIVGGGMLWILGALGLSPAPRAQLIALTCGFTVVLGLFSYEARRARRHQLGERWLFVSLMLTLLGISIGCVITGGLSSPVLPIYFAPVVTTFAAFGRSRESLAALLAMLTLLAGFWLLPKGWPFAPITSPYAEVMAGASTVVSLLLLFASVTGLTNAYREAGERLDALREDLLREASTRMQNLEAVGAKVAHEIKNPLSAIKGLVQLQARGAEEASRSQRRLGVVLEEIQRVEAILQGYLSFSRPLTELALESVALESLLDGLHVLVEPRARASGITLAVRVEAATIEADPRRLKEALLNLLLNAVQATPAGGRVTLSLERRDQGAMIEVRDTGRGMTPEILEALGRPFFTTREEGTGLGVALARGVIQQHGGALTFDSAPGEGTCVRVRLPSYPGAKLDGDSPAGR